MPDELLMRQVPQDLTAEQSLLGAMLVDPNCIPEVIEQVRADDFYAEENKRIFETIYSMFNGAQRIPEAMHGFTTNRTPGWERALDAHCKFFREHLQ